MNKFWICHKHSHVGSLILHLTVPQDTRKQEINKAIILLSLQSALQAVNYYIKAKTFFVIASLAEYKTHKTGSFTQLRQEAFKQH